MPYFIVRGAIKKFSAWPSSAQNKIKIVYASYSSKAQNTTCTIWLLGYKYSVHFSGRRLLAVEMKKRSYAVFVPLHALLFWFRIEVVDTRFILNNELWNKFLLGHIGIVEEVLQKLVHISGVSVLDTIWQTLCSYAEIMHKIFVAQKSHCACRVLMLGTIRSKYYFNFILIRTVYSQAEYFLIFPRISAQSTSSTDDDDDDDEWCTYLQHVRPFRVRPTYKCDRQTDRRTSTTNIGELSPSNWI